MRKLPKHTPVSLLSLLLAGRARVPQATLADLLAGAAHFAYKEGDASGTIKIRPLNRDRSRYRIEEFQFQPATLGKRLLEKAIERIDTASLIAQIDAMDLTTLNVLTEAGFRHYSTVRVLARENLTISDCETTRARLATPQDAEALYDLYCACTPLPIKTIEAPSPPDFAQALTDRLLSMRLRFVVEDSGRLVGALDCQRAGRGWELMGNALPGWEPLLREAIILALVSLDGPAFGFALHYQDPLNQAFESLGFKPQGTELRLVRDSLITLRLPQRPARFHPNDAAFNPAYYDR